MRITPAPVTIFTPTTSGTVPASGGGTTTFLRADGTWSTPAGGGGAGTSTGLSFTLGMGIVLS